MSNLQVNQITSDSWVGTNGTQFIPCRAICQYTDNTTATIEYSQNVSSLTDNGAGDVTINFTNAMPDTDYCVLAGTICDSNGYSTTLGVAVTGVYATGPTAKTTNGCGVRLSASTTAYDAKEIYVGFFGN